MPSLPAGCAPAPRRGRMQPESPKRRRSSARTRALRPPERSRSFPTRQRPPSFGGRFQLAQPIIHGLVYFQGAQYLPAWVARNLLGLLLARDEIDMLGVGQLEYLLPQFSIGDDPHLEGKVKDGKSVGRRGLLFLLHLNPYPPFLSFVAHLGLELRVPSGKHVLVEEPIQVVPGRFLIARARSTVSTL